MIQNYLKIALRNIRKNTLYSFLNIFGLSLGVAACLLIMLYVAHETSYDHWNPQAERIVRPVADINFGGHHFELAVVSSVLGPDVQKELPELQSWCRFRDRGTYLVKREGESQQNIREDHVLNTDSTFFEVFPLKVLEGDARTCLTRPKTLALSRSRAERYFSSPQLALGRTLILENEGRWQVTAVYEDMPVNSHFRADLLLSLNGDDEVKNDPPYWASNNNFQTYLLLRKGTDLAAFSKKFETIARRKVNETAQALIGSSVEDLEKTGQYAHYYLQNLTDIHLHSDLTAELSPNGSIGYVRIFSAIAAFILLIACINFMNLATARSAGRAREVGVRKALGGNRRSLISQFLSESTLIAAFAVLLAVAIAAIAMPWYRDLTGRDLSIPWASPVFWALLAAGVGMVGLLAGSYPAFFLSSFESIRVLKGEVAGVARGGSFRNVLVVFQFAISVVLIIATVMVFRQLSYIQNKKLGFDKNQVLIVEDAYALGDNVYLLKEKILQHPAVASATVSGYLPVPSNRSDQSFSKIRSLDAENAISLQRWRVDNDYLNTLGMEIVKGRAFDPARVTDSSAVIINETAARIMGYDDPIGKKVYTIDKNIQGAPKAEDFVELEVIGVVKDFHWASLRDRISALCLQLGRSRGLLSLRYKGSETASVIGALERDWNQLSTGQQPFNYHFLDDSFASMYDAERRVGAIAAIFGLLSILVSCLGLFGLAAYTTEQRTKEIGIRKVLGASVTGITALLTRDFLKLVLLAIVVAVPAAWYAMNYWLQDFAYHVDLQIWIFIASGLAAILVAFLTVSFQSIKAALSNPVKSLRTE
ncbi:MAG: ABC transporter permease [Lewinellaceae bacterium]|nr:ABC transporter permease [Lewinellaceae bacterium]